MKSIYMIGLLIGILLGSTELTAQQSDTIISRFVISPLGNWQSQGGIEMTYTIGQVAIETEVGVSGQIVLRQGFHQPNDSLNVSIEKGPVVKLDYRIFPNPTKSRLFVELESDQLVDLSIQIFDMAGKKTNIPDESFRLEGKKRLTFDLSELPAAVYSLKLMDRKNRDVKTFKIQKTH